MDTPKNKITEDLKENNNCQGISGSDSELYDFVDSNLKKENVDGFSLGFSKNVIRKIEAKQQRRFNVKIYTLLSFLVLISIPLFVSFLNTDFISMLFAVLLKHKFIFVFLIITVILIQFSEKLISTKKNIQ